MKPYHWFVERCDPWVSFARRQLETQHAECINHAMSGCHQLICYVSHDYADCLCFSALPCHCLGMSNSQHTIRRVKKVPGRGVASRCHPGSPLGIGCRLVPPGVIKVPVSSKRNRAELALVMSYRWSCEIVIAVTFGAEVWRLTSLQPSFGSAKPCLPGSF